MTTEECKPSQAWQDFISQFPEEIAEKIEANTEQITKIYWEEDDDLLGAFIWADTPEGNRYWMNIAVQYS